MSRPRTRRRFLTATAAALAGLGLATSMDADDHQRNFVVEQNDTCVPVVPLTGEVPVEEFYGWGTSEQSYSSTGTRELQESETSLLFLYRGPEGLSLVVVHDALDDETPGGKVSFEIAGIPEDATWAVKDDLYDAPTNVDTWDVDGSVLNATDSTITDDYLADDETDDGTETEQSETDTEGTETERDDDTRTDEIDWWWTTGRTDGGALRGLAVADLELRIEPAFNDEAELADKPNEGEITSWELLSGDPEDPDRTELELDAPLTLRTGSCDDSDGSTPTERPETDGEESGDDEDGEATDEEDESDATDDEDGEATDEEDESDATDDEDGEATDEEDESDATDEEDEDATDEEDEDQE